MNNIEQTKNAKEFVNRWTGRGDEKQDAQSYWRDLLVNVLGVPSASLANFISFERKVQGGFIDAFIEDTGVLIEQKSLGVDLSKPQKQSDGSELTPYGQAARYAAKLPFSLRPRWIITSNFDTILVYDQENDPPGNEPYEIRLTDLPNELYRLSFITDKANSRLERERELSVKAGEVVGKLYASLSSQYQNIEEDPNEQRSLNILIVRLVFLLYAEDAGLLQHHGALYDYLKPIPVPQMRQAIIDLFRVLDTPDGSGGTENKRDPYLASELLEFPYINGGLFSEENIIVPQFTDQIKLDLLVEASSKFDWSDVSPTIFGAVFESTLNPETRRAGGMHYTSIENIHKVIDPLFLDDLRHELESIEALKTDRDRKIKLKAFQRKLSTINILDPACGSGNFLTESYLSLRKLENRVIEGLIGEQMGIGFEGETSTIQVKLSQFYGIEINDFAVSVAKTALWIAESQMIEATQEIVMQVLDFLPLKSNSNIVQGNALRMDWNDVLPTERCTYIVGNPPYKGHLGRAEEQVEDLKQVWNVNNIGRRDYVSGWFKKAVDYAETNPSIDWAFVATNSIAMGEPVAALFNYIFDHGWRIEFAHQTFEWDSESKESAAVHVVIVGFTKKPGDSLLFEYETIKSSPTMRKVANLNGYLLPGVNIAVEQRRTPLSPILTEVTMGNMPRAKNLIIEADEVTRFQADPIASKYIHPFVMGRELIHADERYCLWMYVHDPADIEKSTLLKDRLNAVAAERLASKTKSTQEMSKTPWLFGQHAFVPKNNYLGIPSVFSERREYATVDFLDPNVIPGNKIYVCDDPDGLQFALMSSKWFILWQKAIGGRIKNDPNFSNTVVWNNFPLPSVSQESKQQLIDAGKTILSVRHQYPSQSLADLYDPDKMPSDLLEAHQALDRTVEEVYGVDFNGDEEKIVAHLFKLYADAIGGV